MCQHRREHRQLKGYELSGWFALVGPVNLPEDVTARLRAALATGLKDPAIRRRLEAGGSVPARGDEDLAKLMRDDIAKFAGLVKFANMKDRPRKRIAIKKRGPSGPFLSCAELSSSEPL